jgi:hypothetical protein
LLEVDEVHKVQVTFLHRVISTKYYNQKKGYPNPERGSVTLPITAQQHGEVFILPVTAQ